MFEGQRGRATGRDVQWVPHNAACTVQLGSNGAGLKATAAGQAAAHKVSTCNPTGSYVRTLLHSSRQFGTHLSQRGRIPVYLVGQDGLPHLLQRAVAHVVPERELACKGQGAAKGGRQGEHGSMRVAALARRRPAPNTPTFPTTTPPAPAHASGRNTRPSREQALHFLGHILTNGAQILAPPTREQLVHHDACTPHVTPLVVALLDDLKAGDRGGRRRGGVGAASGLEAEQAPLGRCKNAAAAWDGARAKQHTPRPREHRRMPASTQKDK